MEIKKNNIDGMFLTNQNPIYFFFDERGTKFSFPNALLAFVTKTDWTLQRRYLRLPVWSLWIDVNHIWVSLIFDVLYRNISIGTGSRIFLYLLQQWKNFLCRNIQNIFWQNKYTGQIGKVTLQKRSKRNEKYFTIKFK